MVCVNHRALSSILGLELPRKTDREKDKAERVKVDRCAIQQEYCVGESRRLRDVVCLRLGTAGRI